MSGSSTGSTTSHLGPERLLELSRTRDAPGSIVSAEEKAHLESCPQCGEALAQEESLGRALRALAWPVPSVAFVALVQARFVVAQRAQEIRRRLMAAVASAALATSLLVAIGTMGIMSVKQVLVVVALELKDVVITLDIVATLMSRSPLLPLIAVLGCAGSVALSSVLLAKLLRAPAVAK